MDVSALPATNFPSDRSPNPCASPYISCRDCYEVLTIRFAVLSSALSKLWPAVCASNRQPVLSESAGALLSERGRHWTLPLLRPAASACQMS